MRGADGLGLAIVMAGVGMSLIAALAPWIGALAAATVGLGVTAVGVGVAVAG